MNGVMRQPLRFGSEGLVPSHAAKYVHHAQRESAAVNDCQQSLPQSATPLWDDPLEWTMQWAASTDQKDWRRSLQARYRELTEGDSARIPQALLALMATAPTSLGEFIRGAVLEHLPAFQEDRDDKEPAPNRARDLLPLPWCPEAAEAEIKPLDESRSADCTAFRRGFGLLMVLVLNRQWLGAEAADKLSPTDKRLPKGPPSPAQARALGLLLQSADVFYGMNSKWLSFRSWEKELEMRRTAGYTFDEGTPRNLSWDLLGPTMPPQGVTATVDARQFATGVIRDILDDPSLLLRGRVDRAPSSTKLWVEDQQLEMISLKLMELGILVEVDDSVDVPDGLAEWLEDRCMKDEFGVVLEAGAFGVEKAKGNAILRKVGIHAGEESRPLRLVFNLRPQNAWIMDLDGDCTELANPSQTSNAALLPREIALTSLRDRSSYFYIYHLNPCWQLLQRTKFRSPRGRPLHVQPLAMGLKPAVAIAQHLHRNTVRMQLDSGLRSMGEPGDVRIVPEAISLLNEAAAGLQPELETGPEHPVLGRRQVPQDVAGLCG